MNRRYQRGYAAIPYVISLFSTVGAGGAAAGAGAGAAAAGAGAAAAGAGVAAGTGIGLGTAAGIAAATTAVGLGVGALTKPKTPSTAGMAPPTIDQARQAQQVTDRLKQRTGVLANIYGGSGSGTAPSVGRATLG